MSYTLGCDFLNTGRFLKIDLPKVPRSLQVSIPRTIRPVGCKTVFVKNLPYDTTENQIRELFLVCGPIINIRLAAWSHTNTLKGFGYIEFRREDSADIAGKTSLLLTRFNIKYILLHIYSEEIW